MRIRWMEVEEGDREVVLAGLRSAGVMLLDDQGFRNILLKAYGHLASNSLDWIRAVEIPLTKALLQEFGERDQRAEVGSAMDLIGRMTGPRKRSIEVFVTDEELKRLQFEASAAEVSISEFVRVRVLAVADQIVRG